MEERSNKCLTTPAGSMWCRKESSERGKMHQFVITLMLYFGFYI